MRVVLADYGAGNLRSLSSALARAGVEPVVTVDARLVREAPLALIAGVGHVESAAARARAPRARRRAARARRRRAAGGGDLRRPAAPLRRERRGRRGPRTARRPGSPAARAARPAHGLEHARLRGAPSTLLDGLDGADVYFAHSFAAEPTDPDVAIADGRARRDDRRGGRVRPARRCPVPPGAERRRRAPASSRTSCDGQEARDPLPRRRGRPRRQGRQLREPPRDGGARRARDAATPSSAPTSSSSSTSRRRSRAAARRSR